MSYVSEVAADRSAQPLFIVKDVLELAGRLKHRAFECHSSACLAWIEAFLILAILLHHLGYGGVFELLLHAFLCAFSFLGSHFFWQGYSGVSTGILHQPEVFLLVFPIELFEV